MKCPDCRLRMKYAYIKVWTKVDDERKCRQVQIGYWCSDCNKFYYLDEDDYFFMICLKCGLKLKIMSYTKVVVQSTNVYPKQLTVRVGYWCTNCDKFYYPEDLE